MSARHRPRHNTPRPPRSATASRDRVANLTIDSIAAGGNGVGRVEGMACFVPRTAPGDTVQATLRTRSRFATGEVLQVLEPSRQRVEPRCQHYIADKCGGCQLQHLDADAQRNARAVVVRDALQRIARREVETPFVQSGPSDWEYRRRLTLTLLRRGSRFVGGLHPYDDPSRIFALSECPITHPLLVDAWTTVRGCTDALPDAASLRLGLRLLDDGDVAVIVSGGREWSSVDDFVARVFGRAPFVRSVWWEPEHQPPQLAGSRDARDSQDDSFADDALAFVQVNAAVAALLRDWVTDRVVAAAPRHVVDAYAGSGLLTERLAHAGIAVTSIELDVHATRRAEARVAGMSTVRVRTGSVEQLLPDIMSDAVDAIMVNPPRRGLEPGIPRLLDESSTLQTAVYISCDPATLARDLFAMPRWRIAALRCFDMFPQTAHVETVCVLERETE